MAALRTLIVDDHQLFREGLCALLANVEDITVIAQAFAGGARGYALKDQPAQEIAEAVRTVARGNMYLAPRFSRDLLDKKSEALANDPLGNLSRREREVFDLAVRGFSNEAMATE